MVLQTSESDGTDEQPNDSATRAHHANALKEFERVLQTILQSGLGQVLDETARAHPEVQLDALQRTFESIQRETLELAGRLSEANLKVHRSTLKAQSDWFKVKLATARTASEVRKNNQRLEMEAAANRAMELKLSSLPEGALLAEAKREIGDLKEKIFQLEQSNSLGKEMLQKAHGQLRQAEGKQRAAETELSQLQAEVETAKVSLAELTVDLVDVKQTNMTLEERVKAMKAAFEASKEEVVRLERMQASLMAQRAQAKEEAENTARAHASQLADLSEQLRERTEELMAQAHEKAEAEEMIKGLKAANQVVGKEAAKWRQQLQEMTRSLEEERAASEAQRVASDRARTGSAAEMQRLQEEKRSLEREIAEGKEALQKSLASLNLKMVENKTLAEHVAELVSQLERARNEISQSKMTLTKTLADLNIKVSENQTLEEKVAEVRRGQNAAARACACARESWRLHAQTLVPHSRHTVSDGV